MNTAANFEISNTVAGAGNPAAIVKTDVKQIVFSSPAKEFPIGLNAGRVIDSRFARKNNEGEPQEDWNLIVERVVGAVATAETNDNRKAEFTRKMRTIMLHRKFIPNTPCLVNAGKPGGQLAACFVIGVPDSIEGIMQHAQSVAKIHQTGGGTGQSYEFIRPAGAMVNSTKGVASGPVSFMNIVNTATDVVKQGGVRRGANMGILRVSHPDILRFIHAKNDQTSLTNFNISVTVTDRFMDAVGDEKQSSLDIYREDGWFQLEFDGKPWNKPIFDPITGEDYAIYHHKDDGFFVSFKDRKEFEELFPEYFEKVMPPAPGMVYAPEVWNRMIASAHKYAEPGVIFIDEVNRHNYLKNSMGEITSCNPCAEEMLHDNNACNLGSIDVAKFFVKDSGKHFSIDWDSLAEVISWSVRFLDNVIDVCQWPLPEIEAVVKRTRPIGLGIMGFADLCLKLQIRYGSAESLQLMDVLMRYVRRLAWTASLELGHEKGAFPEYEANRSLYKEFFDGEQMKPFTYNFPLKPRNYEVTTVAPTGTISLVAETSSGIEPNFGWAYVRQDTVGTRVYVHPLAADALGIEVDYTSEDSIKKAAEYVTENFNQLPDYFVTAMDLSSEEHVRLLGAAQRHVDNSISKTCNGKADDTVESVDHLYRLARKLGCKAVSYYRDGSREGQVLTAMVKKDEKATSGTDDNSPLIVEGSAGGGKSDLVKAFSAIGGKRTRPRELQGSTWNIDFDGHKLYVTVNHDGDKVLEVFAAGLISNGVGILASTMLQSDCFTTEEVARKLNKITGTNAVWFNERLLTSPEQAVAECLLIVSRRLQSLPDGSRSSRSAVNSKTIELPPAEVSSKGIDFKECPKCSEMALLTVSGCPTCQECGFSKCS